MHLTIKSNLHDYTVNFQKDISFLKELCKIENAVYVIDENIWNIYKDTEFKILPSDKIIIQKSLEDKKNIDSVCEIYEKIMSFSPRKNMTLISIGGGIVQDITGFVASTLYRGIKWIFVPTTLLAQVDSCIGAKTSLNFKHFKNLVGSFYAPAEIYLYPGFLHTLNRNDFYSGVGEMAKLHLMAGKETTQAFQRDLTDIDLRNEEVLFNRIQKCLEIKKSFIEDDEFDTGRRNMLNYGHYFGHAIESSTDFQISHGQAVVVGMILANKIALNKGLLNKEGERFIYENILKPSLQVSVPVIDADKTVQAMRQDKKNVGKGLALVMLTNNYEMTKIVDLKEDEAKSVLRESL